MGYIGGEGDSSALLESGLINATVASLVDQGNVHEIKILGDGEQRRSFLYIADCIDGIVALMESNLAEPCDIGSPGA